MPTSAILEHTRALSRLPALAGATRAWPAASARNGAPRAALTGSRPGAAAAASADIAAREVAVLLLLGLGAALATAYLRLPLRLPGSSIVYTVFPTALGVALVPRRLAGSLVSAGALTGSALLAGAHLAAPGPGALTSMSATGPLLDVALTGAGTGWRLYLGFMLAGLATNLLAFAVRAGTAMLGLAPGAGGPRFIGGAGRGAGSGAGGGHGLHAGAGALAGAGGGHGLHAGAGALAGALGTGTLWLRGALLTYAAAGLLAGLVSAAAWFRFRRRPA